MSPVFLRRVLSWGATLTLVGGLGWLTTRLPGAGGAAGELRWLLAQPSARGLNRAFHILTVSEVQHPGSSAGLLAPLLRVPDAVVVDNALRLLADLLNQQQAKATPPFDPGLWATFQEWFRSTPDAEQSRHRLVLVELLARAGQSRDIAGRPEYYRWLVTAALRPLRADRAELYRRLSGASILPPGAAERLFVLDGHASEVRHTATQHGYDLRDPATWPALEAEAVAALCSDPVPEIRWAAGRILAVCRDPRGLPAVSQWLQADPHAPPGAAGIIAQLFGPHWRTLLESGSATSAPRPRDRP